MSSPPEHPKAKAVARFTTGRGASPQENRRIVIHLLRGCPECQRRVLEHLGPDLAKVAVEIEADHV
jgi:hypothetical protein